MRSGTTRWLTLAIGGIASAAFVGGVAAYLPTIAVVGAGTAIASVATFAGSTRRRWLATTIASAALGAVLWLAFGTTLGYFWLNRSRLDALVTQIDAVPTITSLQLGHDEAVAAPINDIQRFDSYRFINEQLVTRYRRRVAPDAPDAPDTPQPTVYEDDLLHRLQVPVARYHALRATLDALSLSGFDRIGRGGIALDERMPGGTPWGNAFLYLPTDDTPAIERTLEQRRLAPHWFYITRG
ncbi:hypothetical protein SAMN05216551_102243 [Chitinasiproducens palmae]|uniref:Uncharacterized protein n=2 Tax=Chitinasiproducens palmae TaxID=1770053 RepID=A0A1H2PKW1_9BURK|nr:hypothetical protein SAMN05216551_102243 [Chitinasiproducens palmae]